MEKFSDPPSLLLDPFYDHLMFTFGTAPQQSGVDHVKRNGTNKWEVQHLPIES